MVVLAIVVVSASFLLGFGYNQIAMQSPGGVPAVVAAATQPPPEFGIFWEAWNILQREYFGTIPSPKEMTYAAIRGVIKALNDPHTVFVEPQGTQLQGADLKGEFGGIGAALNLVDNQTTIAEVFSGSPAEKAGLLPGDIIMKVNDKETPGLSLDDVVLLIRGPKGTRVKLTILRPGTKDPLTFEIVRDIIALPTVRWEVIENDIGYIRLSLFSEKSSNELVKAIQDLKGKKVKAIIFDLRNNPGGLLTASVDVASQFIADGVIAYERDKAGRERVFHARGGGQATDIPLVVLVNKASASASEIVAGAIQDRQRGALIGETTFGKGSVQNVHELKDGSSIHVTIAEWLTPHRQLISQQGLVPDIAIPMTAEDLQKGRDPQLERAVQYLRTGK